VLTPYNPPDQCRAGLSQAVGIEGSSILVTSGITATDDAGNVIEGDFEAQVIAVYRNIGKVLAAAGLGFDSIARITTYLTHFDVSMIPTIRKVRGRHLSEQCPPASVMIGVAALYDPRLRIEVEIIAVRS
jgi:enamine deaminase RidA (YjgF/YER057c/UK114 family)